MSENSNIGENISEIYGAQQVELWNQKTQYKQYDKVQFNGFILAAKDTPTKGVPPLAQWPVKWELLGNVLHDFESNGTGIYSPIEIEESPLVRTFLVNPLNYASSSKAGLIKIGNGLNITKNGVLSTNAIAYESGNGIIIDGNIISADTSIFLATGEPNSTSFEITDGADYVRINAASQINLASCICFEFFGFTLDAGSVLNFTVTPDDTSRTRCIFGLPDTNTKNFAREVIFTNGTKYLPCEVTYDLRNNAINYEIHNNTNEIWDADGEKCYLKHCYIGGSINYE